MHTASGQQDDKKRGQHYALFEARREVELAQARDWAPAFRAVARAVGVVSADHGRVLSATLGVTSERAR